MNTFLVKEHEAKALMRVKGDIDNYNVLMDMFKRTLSALDVENRELEGPALHRSQGRALLLSELIEAFDSASKVVQLSKRIKS